MNYRSTRPLLFPLLIASAFAASACSSSSSPSTPTDSGIASPDATGTNPSDAGAPDGAIAPSGDSGGQGPSDSGGGGPTDAVGAFDAIGEGEGGTFDFNCGGGTGCSTSQVCCSKPGPTISFSCVAPASCSPGDQLVCDGPDECGGTTPVCCAVAVGDGTGTFPACGSSSVGASCTSAAACPIHIGTCSQTSKLQLCHKSSECTDPTNNKCCLFGADGGAPIAFCIDPATAALGGGSCH